MFYSWIIKTDVTYSLFMALKLYNQAPVVFFFFSKVNKTESDYWVGSQTHACIPTCEHVLSRRGVTDAGLSHPERGAVSYTHVSQGEFCQCLCIQGPYKAATAGPAGASCSALIPGHPTLISFARYSRRDSMDASAVGRVAPCNDRVPDVSSKFNELLLVCAH